MNICFVFLFNLFSNIYKMYRLLIFLFLLCFYSCANIQAPSGGPPDTTPPKIKKFYPNNNTTNFNDKILIEFDKWMDRTSVIENLSILPDIQFEYNWSGKELEINFKEKLKENTTYSLILGTQYKDYYNNKPESAFSLVFSSGNNIDTGKINGQVIGEKIDGAYIFAYTGDKNYFDTLNPKFTKPAYRIQIGTNGKFTITALKDGTYRLIVIKDLLKNALYDFNDPYGVYTEDVEVIKGKSKDIVIKMGDILDNIPPSIVSINSPSIDKVAIKFSKRLVDTSFYNSKFFITDTLFSDTINIKAKYKNTFEENTYEIIPETKLNHQKVYTLIFNKENLPYDSNFNNLDINRIPKFITYNKIDSLPIRLFTKPFKDSSLNIPLNPIFDYTFNNAINKENLILNYSLFQKSNNTLIELDTIPTADNQIILKPRNALNENTDYLLRVEFKNVSSLNNSLTIDTTIILNFKTDDFRNSGSISGKFINNNLKCKEKLMIVLYNKNYRFQKELNDRNEFVFINIPADTYNIEVYCDKNNNKKYDYGRVYPFEFAEEFYIHNQTITVKARWMVENIQIIETND